MSYDMMPELDIKTFEKMVNDYTPKTNGTSGRRPNRLYLSLAAALALYAGGCAGVPDQRGDGPDNRPGIANTDPTYNPAQRGNKPDNSPITDRTDPNYDPNEDPINDPRRSPNREITIESILGAAASLIRNPFVFLR